MFAHGIMPAFTRILSGEMTHPKFIQHYHIDETAVSSVGNIDYNEKTGKWEFLSKPGCLFVGTDETRKNQRAVK